MVSSRKSCSKDATEDAELIARLRQGNPAAMEYLYDTYFDRIYSLVFNALGRDQTAAEDVVQESFLAAIRSVKGFRGDSSLYTWLCSIAYRKVADFQRRQVRERRHRQHVEDIDSIGPGQLSRIKASVPDMAEAVENREFVEKAMSRIPQDYRQALILKYVEEMSVFEISQVMGRSPKSVEGLLTRARKALRADQASPVNG